MMSMWSERHFSNTKAKFIKKSSSTEAELKKMRCLVKKACKEVLVGKIV